MSYGSQEAKLAAIEIVKGSEDAVDLRSDTVTKPTPAMRKVQYNQHVILCSINSDKASEYNMKITLLCYIAHFTQRACAYNYFLSNIGHV